MEVLNTVNLLEYFVNRVTYHVSFINYSLSMITVIMIQYLDVPGPPK